MLLVDSDLRSLSTKLASVHFTSMDRIFILRCTMKPMAARDGGRDVQKMCILGTYIDI